MSGKSNHHDWDTATNRCRRCGLHITKAHSLVWGCNIGRAKRTGYRKQPAKKKLSS